MRASMLVVALLAGFTGCSPEEKPPASGSASGIPAALINTTLDVAMNTQATIGDLRIGAANARTGEYVDASGAMASGRLVGLWIFVRGDAAKNQKLSVHEGQVVRADKYELTVEEISKDPEPTVRLHVEEKPAPAL